MKQTDLRQRPMKVADNIRELFAALAPKVDDRKLAQVSIALERGFGAPLDAVAIGDPIEIRRLLAEQLKRDGSSAGIVQAYEQFFMGLVRRAALDGLIPPPPEGPWTQQWQAVLD